MSCLPCGTISSARSQFFVLHTARGTGFRLFFCVCKVEIGSWDLRRSRKVDSQHAREGVQKLREGPPALGLAISEDKQFDHLIVGF